MQRKIKSYRRLKPSDGFRADFQIQALFFVFGLRVLIFYVVFHLNQLFNNM